ARSGSVPRYSRPSRSEMMESAPPRKPARAILYTCTLHASSIPKGLCPQPQGCEERATLGNGRVCASTPKELCHYGNNAMPQSCVWDCSYEESAQPLRG